MGLIIFFLEDTSRRKIPRLEYTILGLTSTCVLLDYEQAWVIASMALGHQD